MEKAAFADTVTDAKWWLLDRDVDYQIDELRKDVGNHLGWGRDDQWYTEKWKLEELYDLLEKRQYELLRELDEATEDHKRLDWITKVVELTNPTTANGAAHGAAPETVPAAPAAPAQPEVAPAKPSPFGAKDAGAEAAKPSPFGKRAAAAEETQAQLDAAVKDVMAHLAPEKLGVLASEFGVSEEELAGLVKDLPPDFESLVAAEAAKLAGAA